MEKHKKIIIAGIVFTLFFGAFFYFDLGQFLSFEYLKSKQSDFTAYYLAQPWLTVGIFSAVYITVTALSLPGAAVLTLLGGALFGLAKGLLIVSFTSTIGATLAFLVARFLLRDSINAKFGTQLKGFNQGIEKEGLFYLFTLRLIPVVPFFVINLVMGLTPIKTGSFFVVSQIGMLAGTAVYVNAGTQLAQLESLSGILSPKLILSFAILGLFPLAAKKIISLIKNKNDSQHD